MRKVPQCAFDFYALSLPRGHDFGDEPPVAAWGGLDCLGCGIVTHNAASDTFGIILMRIRVDSVWAVTWQHDGYLSADQIIPLISRRYIAHLGAAYAGSTDFRRHSEAGAKSRFLPLSII